MFSRTALVVALWGLAGCGGLFIKADAGSEDSGDSDSGVVDAGPGCDAGFHDCSGSCTPDDSLTQCGPSCQTCTPPQDSIAVCNGGCDFVCASPLLKCGARCCKAIAVTAGVQHTCALTELGTVKCWGYGMGIGDGTFGTFHLVSVDIAVGGDAGVAQLSASSFNTCALLTSGALRCWGNNAYGSVGDGTTLPHTSPFEIFGQGVSAIAHGGYFGCAVVGDAVQCWGLGTTGQLGNGLGMDRSAPGPVSGLLSGVSQVSAGTATVCVTTDAGYQCWGSNDVAQCGDGTTVNPRLLPVTVKALDAGVLELQQNLWTTCGLTAAHGVKCFGGNLYGTIGDGTVNGPRFTAVEPIGLANGVLQLAGGSSSEHFCAVIDGGAVRCWGRNDYGQLGDTTVVEKHQPTQVSSLLSGVKWVATGEKHTCAVTVAGGVKCWGRNDMGQLGDGTKVDRYVPTDVR